MNGYGGSILRINLTTAKISKESTPTNVMRDFIGGRGFGAYYLFKEVPKGADPLGTENKLIISSGPMSGLMIPGAGKCDFTTKSPLTGGYASASMGGHFTAEMKYAGLDSIILEGISSKPVYLFIDNDKIELRDANELWGKGTITVEKHFKEVFGEEFQVAVIGPGGENLVSYACINHDFGRQAGRGGVGAVMGVKKLKAIVIHGTKSISVADNKTYRQAGKALYKACKEASFLPEWTRYGTTVVTSWCDEVGALPTRNFSAGSFEDGKNLYAPVMREKIVITDKGCFGCPSPCGKYSRSKKYGSNVEGPEYETIGLMGSNLGISDIEAVAQANLLADDLGIDTISAGNAIGWAMECYEKGIFTKDDTDGVDLKFGNVEATFDLIGKIARKEGLGALLAEGVKKASRKIGKGTEKFAIHVKGMEQSAYATHNATAMLLAYMTCDVGAHHNRSWAITYDLQVGRDLVVPEKVGERIWNLTRLFWARENEGFGRNWDMPAPRFYEEAPKSGATKGQITKLEDVNLLLDMYYEQRGWTSDGLPTHERLSELNLSDLVV